MQRKLNMLGLATRARLIVSGDEFVEDALKKNKVYLVVCANDASQKTIERYKNLTTKYNVALDLTFDSVAISNAIGKARRIIALTDEGMAKKYLSYENKQNGENMMKE